MRKFSGRLRKADAFRRWSFTEIEPQGLLREQVWHIYCGKFLRLDFRRYPGLRGRSVGSIPEQRLVIDPKKF